MCSTRRVGDVVEDDDTNVVGKAEEDGGESGHQKFENVGVVLMCWNRCGSGANDKMPIRSEGGVDGGNGKRLRGSLQQ